MAGKEWESHEIDYLMEHGPSCTCEEIAKVLGRTKRAVQHQFNLLGIKKNQSKIGDIINGWKIIKLYEKNIGSQNVTYAEVESTISNKTSHYRLTKLTKGKVGWPDRRRPDVTKKNITHGLTGHRLYRIWYGMKNRCYNKKQLAYKNYGSKGISICDSWLNFKNFYDWAMNNGYNGNLSLDRIDINKNYEPLNCKWTTYKEQSINKSNSYNITAWNETKNASDWALDSRCNTSYSSIIYRVNMGWKPEDAISIPSKNKLDNFKRYKSFYKFVKQNYPQVVQEFLDKN